MALTDSLIVVFSGLLFLATLVLAWATWRLVVATEALRLSQENEWARLRPRVRILAPNASFGDLLPLSPFDITLINEGQQETVLSELRVTSQEGEGSGTRGYPVRSIQDAVSGENVAFPLHIPGASFQRFRVQLAGTHPEIIKGSRVRFEGRLTRGDLMGTELKG